MATKKKAKKKAKRYVQRKVIAIMTWRQEPLDNRIDVRIFKAIDVDDALEQYSKITGFDPDTDLNWQAFHLENIDNGDLEIVINDLRITAPAYIG